MLGQLPQAGWAGLEAPAPSQLLGFSLQPLPPVSGVPCHNQSKAGVPHSRGTDQSGEKVQKGQALSQAGGDTLCLQRRNQSKGGWKCLAAVPVGAGPQDPTAPPLLTPSWPSSGSDFGLLGVICSLGRKDLPPAAASSSFCTMHSGTAARQD